MRDLVRAAMAVLREMYDAEAGRFSATTLVIDGRYVNDFSTTLGLRYSVNSLLGLARASGAGYDGWDVEAALDLFLEQNRGLIQNAGDAGLLLWALTEAHHTEAEAWCGRAVARVEDVMTARTELPLQEICWMLSGLSQYATESGDTRSAGAARDLFKLLRRRYLDADSRLPLHRPAGWRTSIVSFGGIVYFLRALWDFYGLTHDQYALVLFRELTTLVIRQQGLSGEWSWLYHTPSGRAIERYQVYSVHQEAMAMLFLLPALSLDVPDAETAIRRSYRWILGDNELQKPMWRDEPFLVYRSIRRTLPLVGRASTNRISGISGAMDRGSNLAHAIVSVVLGTEARTAPRRSVEVNPECQSYEMGWTAYVWAGVTGFEEFTDIAAWPTAADH